MEKSLSDLSTTHVVDHADCFSGTNHESDGVTDALLRPGLHGVGRSGCYVRDRSGNNGETCAGVAATCCGSAGNDVLNGTGSRDVIWGGAGNDEIDGNGGNDLICGGNNGDTINGNAGDDTIYGENGPDNIDGGDGLDALFGGDDQDQLWGGSDDDELFGGPHADILWGRGGDDELAGGDQDDLLCGNDGDDVLSGGSDNDTLCGGDQVDTLSGGGGDDELNPNFCVTNTGDDHDSDGLLDGSNIGDGGTDTCFLALSNCGLNCDTSSTASCESIVDSGISSINEPDCSLVFRPW